MRARFIFFLALVLVACVACAEGPGASPSGATPVPAVPAPASTSTPAPPPGFVRREFQCFVLIFPEDWQIEVEEGGMRIWLESSDYMVSITSGAPLEGALDRIAGQCLAEGYSVTRGFTWIWGWGGPYVQVEFPEEGVFKYISLLRGRGQYMVVLSAPSSDQLEDIPRLVELEWK